MIVVLGSFAPAGATRACAALDLRPGGPGGHNLWDRLLTLCDGHEMRYHWVKGHAENQFNNRCDQLAVAESQKYK